MGSHVTTLRPAVLSDLAEHTAFSAEEIRTYYKAFLTECEQSRLTVDLERFEELYRAVFPEGDPTEFAEQVFRAFDSDGSGRVDFHEFMLTVSIQQKGSTSDKMEFLFKMFDLEGTGFIEMDDLIKLIEALRKLRISRRTAVPSQPEVSSQDIAHHIMVSSDKDRDQKLSLAEFLAAAESSTTMQRILQGALNASSSPFARRHTSGSLQKN